MGKEGGRERREEEGGREGAKRNGGREAALDRRMGSSPMGSK
jgi:hypothetical protein